MEKKPQESDVDHSVADRVLKAFIEAVSEDDMVSDLAERLSTVLLDSDSVKEADLRQALFNEKESS